MCYVLQDLSNFEKIDSKKSILICKKKNFQFDLIIIIKFDWTLKKNKNLGKNNNIISKIQKKIDTIINSLNLLNLVNW